MSFFKWFDDLLGGEPEPAPVSEASKVTLALMDAFANNKIVGRDLSNYGISTLAVESPFGWVSIEWHSPRAGGGLSSLSVGGENYPYSTDEIELILNAAKKRARQLWNEDQQHLERMLDK
ncbi:hypothetical protein PHIN3_388 [Sinorhizobium phage phiN3]|uniref:Uncharacterized protein n=1 Tax=Sinorhizobium phage phiN3 TaxID=1647405 RepID=A0A0F6WD11_9CAUD|nr:hypothetical protein AVT40_gp145 [Sinorhizobium phage phiN3]AKF13651.1 hypothetical protein PHIN3_388 [Sinorhizobium phage phiN3]